MKLNGPEIMTAIMNIKLGCRTPTTLAAVTAGFGQQTTFTQITNGAVVTGVGSFAAPVRGKRDWK